MDLIEYLSVVVVVVKEFWWAIAIIATIVLLNKEWLIRRNKDEFGYNQEAKTAAEESPQEDTPTEEMVGDEIDLSDWKIKPICAHCGFELTRISVIWNTEKNSESGNFYSGDLNIAFCPECKKPIPLFYTG